MEKNTISKLNKVERYSWTVKDEPGKYMLINKRKLGVKLKYQREPNKKKILQIARKWSWIACGALTVAYSPEENEYHVIDGQHRKLAADEHPEIKELPCLVFDVQEMAQEADSFIVNNTMRVGLKKIEKLPAQLIRGDAHIIELVEMLEETGHEFSGNKGPKKVSFLSALEKSYLEDERLTKDLWPKLVEIADGGCVDGQIWKGLYYLGKRYQMEPHILKLKNAGIETIRHEIRKKIGFNGKGGDKIYAYGILEIINKGKEQKNRLTI
jgi:hypothetical protein